MLLRQLERRFGLLPQKVRGNVLAIREVSTLGELTQRVLGAKNLDSPGL